MGIELQLTSGGEEWSFNLTEAVIPGPGDNLTIDDPDGRSRDFRVVGKRIYLSEGDTVGSVMVAVDLEAA
jgi:hypothetical protein